MTFGGSRWRPKKIGGMLRRFRRSADRHYNHSKATHRKDRYVLKRAHGRQKVGKKP